jgi:hypothetical protein
LPGSFNLEDQEVEMDIALGWGDVSAAVVALMATLIAATKDVWMKREATTADTGEPPKKAGYVLDFSKLTPTAIIAIVLAVASFGVGLFLTNKAKVGAREAEQKFQALQDRTVNIGKTSDAILEEVKIKLPGIVKEAVTNGTSQLEQKVKDAVGGAEETFRQSLADDADKSAKRFNTGIGNTIAQLNTTRNELSTAIGQAKTQIKETQSALKGIVEQEVTNSQGKVTKAISTEVDKAVGKIEESANRITDDFNQGIETQILHLPLQLAEHTPPRRLYGKLSNLFIEVDNVSHKNWFPVAIKSEDSQHQPGPLVPVTCLRPEVCRAAQNGFEISPKFKDQNGKTQRSRPVVQFAHNGHRYQLEMTIQTSHNLLGTGTDYVICSIVELKETQDSTGDSK